MDEVNATNKDWSQEPELEGELADQPDMVESHDSGDCDLIKQGNEEQFLL